MPLTPASSHGSASPSIVTSLPAGAATGDQVLLRVGSGDTAVLWLMQYDATITDAYKWRYLGGTRLYANLVTQATTTSGTFVELNGGTPALTLPFVGVYEFTHGCRVIMTTGSSDYGIATVKTNGANPAGDDEAVSYTGAAVNKLAQVARVFQRTVSDISTSALAVQVYRAAGTPGFADRWLSVRPVRM